MAALEWIKNNIQAFGGNPNAVTVMGHGTGAACANFLMMAPPVSNNSEYYDYYAFTYTVNELMNIMLKTKGVHCNSNR